MRLLRVDKDGAYTTLTEDKVGDIPPYAILSHTWGQDQDEVTYRDLNIALRSDKAGYRKVEFCAKQAAKDGLHFVWIDTCCIDKTNSTELNEAINSMFKWYQKAKRAYVFLSDVHTEHEDVLSYKNRWLPQFRGSRWFTRGWTLQELLAPSSVEFFCSSGKKLGDKKSLERELSDITGISIQALQGTSLSKFTVAERFSWAESRHTKREEDLAYSMLGIFHVYIPLIYGEGKTSAMRRLQEEIDKDSHAVQDTILLSSLHDALDAPFNAYRRQHEPLCLGGTRVQLLDDIYTWAEGNDGRTIFWLNGLAGTGKSTISRTVARQYFDKRQLGASFFFSRGGGDVGHADKFVTSIALQLARSIPALHSLIVDTMKERPDIASRSLHDQWHELVLRPLSKVKNVPNTSSFIIVVDALDECANESDVQVLLHLLSQVRLLTNIRLRILLTSRPEVPIRYGFSQVPHGGYRDFVLHNIDPSIVDNDIYLFLVHQFRVIRQERYLDASWPGEHIIRYLVKIASGLFIWAATACRFIREGKRFAPKRLEVILKNSQGTVTEPEKHLDEIYSTVLRQTVSSGYSTDERLELYGLLKKILGSIITLLSPLCVSSLSRLIRVPPEDANQTLNELHSILDIPRDHGQPLRLHHPSFRDFLISKERCTDSNFYVNEMEMHNTLLGQCLQIMSQNLKQDICGLQDSGIATENVDTTRFDIRLPREAKYACMYWIQHLEKSKRKLQDHGHVHKFIERHLLHWLEAMTWLGKVSEAMYAIEALKSLTKAGDCPRLSEFVYDVRRFVSYSRSAFEKNPLQIYTSALLFAPEKSIVRKQFQTQVPRWIGGLPTVRTDWNALIQTLEGHNKQYYAMCFSSDSKSLASAAFDGSIRICDAATGVERQIFQLDGDSVVTMAFSPDNSILASATRYRTIRLWNASTGVEMNSLEGHEDSVKVITFSSSGQLLASGSKDKTVKLWNVNSGTMLYTLEGHEGEIITINFLRSATLLGTTSKDKSEIKIWDISNGSLHDTRGPYDEYGDPLAVSASGKFLANKALSSIVRLWDTETGEEVQRWQDHEMITCAAFSPDEDTLVNGSFETIKMWDIESGELEQRYLGHKGWLSELLFSPDAKMLASASNDQNIKLWDLTLEPQLDAETVGHSGWINCVVFSPDNKLIASASHDHTLQLWSATTSLSKQMLGCHETWISDVLFSPDNRLLASAGDKTIKIWNVYNYGELFKLEKHQDWMTNIIFSHDSKLLASVSIDKTVCIWSVTNGALVFTSSGDNIRLESPLSYSLTTGDSTHVTFSNQSNFDINCFWIDTQGISKHYWTLRPNEETYQQTYVGHFWRFVNASTSQTIGAYTGVPEHVYVYITNEDVAMVEGNKQYLIATTKESGLWPSARTSEEESKLALQIHDNWITLPSGKRLIWLPDEYRPTYYKMKNDTLVLGHASGQVTVLNIKVAAIRSSLHEYFPFLVKRERMDFSSIPNHNHEVD